MVAVAVMAWSWVVEGLPSDEPTLTHDSPLANLPPLPLPAGLPIGSVGLPLWRQPLPAAGAQQLRPCALVAGLAGCAGEGAAVGGLGVRHCGP